MKFFDNLIDVKIEKDMGILGVTDEFFCVYLYSIFNKYDKNILVVVDSITEANLLYSKLVNFTEDVLLFPMDDFLTSEALAISPDLMMERLNTLNCLVKNEKKIVICNLTGYLRFLPNVDTYKKSLLTINVGDEIDPKLIQEKIYKLGYRRDSLVNQTGEVAYRGYIIDVYPVGEDNPIRIEFFGDEISSIRYFDPDNQRSLEEINNITVEPYFEFITFNNVPDEEFNKQKYLPLYEKVNSISDYIEDGITIFKDYNQLTNSFKSICEEIKDYREEKDKEFSGNYMFNLDEIIPKYPLYYLSINNISDDYVKNEVTYDVKTVPSFHENLDLILRFLREYLNKKYTILILLKNYQIKNFSKKLNFDYEITTFDKIYENKINIIESNINTSFIYDKYVVLTEKELFNEQVKKHKYRNKYKYTTPISDFSKLDVGDYVVHDLYGVGIYNGIKTLVSNGLDKDYLEILYAGSDKIYIPVEKIDLLFKYSGREGLQPKINSLNGTDWDRTKKRVLNKIHDLADELIKLYSERNVRHGFAFSKDNDLLEEFEKAFPYELTKDQKNAIADIKEDMEKDVPMDRLLCGDVGFGKTEVAFVAAFKAILDSKQVLFLCPTTILSNQHYQNAIERFKEFPVNIAILNRFSSPSEVRKAISGLKDGSVDMVFGTHRLLSEDVKPKNLGLLIIDEEQRFGVKHKEKIKQYKTNVDVLTLTATPIPRTLQMSLVGIRSLSLISTPPVDRYPVQTYVIEENNQLIKSAILKEISRGGQVFVLYNRVESIEYEKEKLLELVPNAKIGVAHGQLKKQNLEDTLYRFINKEYDVLLCSTIIETGIDMPNVNTLIILDADRFGLAQLYQIRGRVGRSNRFAYAYLMYKPYKKLTSSAVKRLNVIKEFTELGSGFSIANRDLSIRGAGDILGSEQAGFIDSVGIDLYLKLLNEEVERRGEEQVEEEKEDYSHTLLNISTHISDNMAAEDEVKIEIHKLINTVDSEQKFASIKDELEDRFGKLDENIIIYMYEKWFEKLCNKLNIISVHETKNFIELVVDSTTLDKVSAEDIFVESVKLSERFKFKTRGNNLVIILNIIRLDEKPIYLLVKLLSNIVKYIK